MKTKSIILMTAVVLIIGLLLDKYHAIYNNNSNNLLLNPNGSILYGITSGGVIFRIDTSDCSICPVMSTMGYSGGTFDILLLPDGNILVFTAQGLRLYNPPSSTPIWSDNQFFGGGVIAPNGTIYLSAPNTGQPPGLYTFDPLTNNITFIGSFPSGVSVSEIFYMNGVLYGYCGQPLSAVLEINVNNPGQSNIIYNNSPLVLSAGIANGGFTTTPLAGDGKVLYQYVLATNSVNQLCDFTAFLPPVSGALAGLSDVPAGFTDLPCLCNTFAGTVNNQTFNICVPPGSVTVPYNNNATLGAGDILQYILFSDPVDTLGSIIVQSSSTTIAFNPATMQTGATYYLATIAGDNLNGNVDLDDPCLDISNTAAQVTWRSQPAVVFSLANPDVCAGDCTTVTATFTGTPPFTLSYTFLGNTFTRTFSSNTGNFQVCIPAGTAQGGVNLSAIALEDTWCSCQ
jgi:hypothetical protein